MPYPVSTDEASLPGSVYRWRRGENAMPVYTVRVPQPRSGLPLSSAPPWHRTGPAEAPFDFCGHVQRLLRDLAVRCPTFHHVRPEQILVGITQARTRVPHGLQARMTPLRFAAGKLQRQRRGVTYQVQRYFLDDVEFLYLLTFCLPRYLDQDFDEKIVTVFHELYHISPAFDGDLRRHDGRYALHSRSQRSYDRQMAELAREYLQGRPDPDLHAFLRLNFEQLQERHGSIVGVMVPRPKILPLLADACP